MPNKTFTQFRVDNVVTTTPTTLSYGQEVYYKDPSGRMTLYVGDQTGTAVKAIAPSQYEWIGVVSPEASNFTVSVIKNDLPFTLTLSCDTNGVVYTDQSFVGKTFYSLAENGNYASASNSIVSPYFSASNTPNDDNGDGVPIGSLIFSSWQNSSNPPVLVVHPMLIKIVVFP